MNGAPVGSHEGGHLPFVLTLEPYVLNFGRANRVTIAVNNTLTSTSVPAGVVQLNIAGRHAATEGQEGALCGCSERQWPRLALRSTAPAPLRRVCVH